MSFNGALLPSRLQSIQRKLDRSMFDRETGNSEFKVGELDEFMKSQVFILWSYYFPEHRLDCTQTRAQRIVDFEEESGGAVPGPVVRGRDGSAAEAGRQVHHQELQ